MNNFFFFFYFYDFFFFFLEMPQFLQKHNIKEIFLFPEFLKILKITLETNSFLLKILEFCCSKYFSVSKISLIYCEYFGFSEPPMFRTSIFNKNLSYSEILKFDHQLCWKIWKPNKIKFSLSIERKKKKFNFINNLKSQYNFSEK